MINVTSISIFLSKIQNINDHLAEYQVVIFILIPIFTLLVTILLHYRSNKSKKEDSEGTATSGSSISEEKSEMGSISDAIEQLCNLRQELKPPELDRSIFPIELRIIGKFNRNGKLRIHIPRSIGSRIFAGAICLPHYFIFPEMIVRGLDILWFGGIVGLLLWLWRNWKGFYISIDLSKGAYWLFEPGAFSKYRGFPDIEIKCSREENQRRTVWRTTLSIADHQVIERVSEEKPKIDDLETFTKSLQWRLGQPIKVGDGVYISP